MSVLAWEIVGSLARQAGTLLSGYLITHHIMSAADGDTFTAEFVKHVMLVLPLAISAAWSIWQKTAKDTKLGAAVEQIAAMQSIQKVTP